MPTDLRYDTAYLEQMLRKAMMLHRPQNLEQATVLADIRDYLMYLTLDALDDEALAKTLIAAFTRLQGWLENVTLDTWSRKLDPTASIFYSAFLFALEQLLSLKRGIPMLPGEKISREDFKRSWKKTAEKLSLT